MTHGITRVMSFTSGKGGVGKTTCSLNIGINLARQGRSVLILDADLGLANLDIMLGMKPTYTLFDVIEGRKSMQDIMLNGPEGISVIPAASGVEKICNLEPEQRVALMDAIEEVASSYDYLLIDTQAGIGPDVLYFNAAAQEVVCVITGEPTSLTDAYATIKLLSRNYGERTISILVNNIGSESEARNAFSRLANVVSRYLAVDLRYLGVIPSDPAVRDAISQQRALAEIFPSSKAALAFRKVAHVVDERFLEARVKGGMQFFFRQLLEVGAYDR